ncbi:MAG: transglutaminase-like domain-containing protein [Planctomycetota bacterium]
MKKLGSAHLSGSIHGRATTLRRSASAAVVAAACTLPAVSSDAQPDRISPIVTRSEPQDWRLRATISLSRQIDSIGDPFLAQAGIAPRATDDPARDFLLRSIGQVEEVPVSRGTFYFPFAGSAASYEVDRESVSASARFNGRSVPLVGGLSRTDASGEGRHSGAAYGIWSFGPADTFSPGGLFEIEFDARAWNTRLDERAARTIGWPTGEWPEPARRSLEPMLFIDRGFLGPYDRAPVEAAIDAWIGDRAQSQPPVVLAKWLAGKLAREFQPIGGLVQPDSIAGNAVRVGRSLGAMQGFRTIGAPRAVATMQGAPVDLPLALVALYREAGLPARLVIGFVAGEEGGLPDPVRRSDEPPLGLYAWVEFALYDESAPSLDEALTWVPVDILAMRAGNVGRRPLDQPWPGFGGDDYFNELVPLAYHLHPHELPAVSYGRGISDDALTESAPRRLIPLPSLWGWNIEPRTPDLLRQALAFSVTTPSIRRSSGDGRDEGN